MSDELKLKTPIQPWGAHPFPAQESILWKIGPLRLWTKSISDELWVAYEYAAENELEQAEAGQPSEDTIWSRWALKEQYGHIRFVPVFPDRPVLVKPEHTFRVLQETEARIYARIPIWLKIEVGNDSGITLIEIPTVALSNTWFGEFTEGELCYWISTGARRQIEPDTSRPFLAICPIQIKNESSDELFFEKLCLRVEYLSLFLKDGQLWANETRIRYRGKAEKSHIDHSSQIPDEAVGAELIGLPRNDDKKGLVAKTFSTLKELPGFGLLNK